MMETVRESWTDKRLDDLNDKVDRIDVDLRALRVETRTEFTALRGEMKDGFESINQRFDALHRSMVQFSGIMIAALVGLIATQ
jgi:hypothetical protein